jgi:SAM-dependent methyltransferase
MASSLRAWDLSKGRMDKRETLDEAMRQGRDRLYPSLTNPNWLVLRERRRIFQRWIKRVPMANLNILDVGGRIQPYRQLITNQIRQYIAVDLRATPLVNVMAQAQKLPFREGHFDLVICTQMLEYAPEPASVIAEILRVLKPGGNLWLSVPSAAPDPGDDFWRLLPAGLCSLLSSFHRVEIVPEGGSVAGLFRSINACLDIFARYRVVRSLYRYTLCPIVNLTGAILEKASGGRNQQFTANYSVLAEK